jgi:hypothetical protein
MLRNKSSNKKLKKNKINEKIKSILYKRRRLILSLSILLFLIIIFFDTIKMGIILGILLLLNITISYLSKNIPRYNTSLELIMFSTVLSAVSYGAKVGAIVGIVFSILYYFAANRMSLYIIVFTPLYAFFGIIAALLPYNNIFVLGMICVLLYSITSSILISIFFRGHIDKALGFILINTLFNLIIFKYLAPLFLFLMN